MTLIHREDYKAVVAASLHSRTVMANGFPDTAEGRDSIMIAMSLLNQRVNERCESDGEDPVEALSMILLAAIQVAGHTDLGCCSLTDQSLNLAAQ